MAAAAAAVGGPGSPTGAAAAARGRRREEERQQQQQQEDEEVDALEVAAASPPPLPFGRLPSVGPSPDAGMLWEVQPPMGISPAMPFMTGHPLHGAHAGIPPPPSAAPPLTTAGVAGLVGSIPPGPVHGSVGIGGEGGLPSNSDHKSPRLSPTLLAQVTFDFGCKLLPNGTVGLARSYCAVGAQACLLRLLADRAQHTLLIPAAPCLPPSLCCRRRRVRCCGWMLQMFGLVQKRGASLPCSPRWPTSSRTQPPADPCSTCDL